MRQWIKIKFVCFNFVLQFLELMLGVEHYGSVVFGPCTADLSEVRSTMTVSVGSNELSCSSKDEHFCLPINMITRWHVNMHVVSDLWCIFITSIITCVYIISRYCRIGVCLLRVCLITAE